VTLGHGGAIDGQVKWTGGTTAVDQWSLQPGAFSPPVAGDWGTVQVQRLADSDDYYVFKVLFS
jgi:hypothetical protein